MSQVAPGTVQVLLGCWGAHSPCPAGYEPAAHKLCDYNCAKTGSKKLGKKKPQKGGKNGFVHLHFFCIYFAFSICLFVLFSFKFCFLMFDVFSFFCIFSSLKIIRINYRGEHKGIITPKRSKKCIL